MESLFSGLVLAGVSALAFVAYRHPKEFKVIEAVLSIGLSIIFICLVIWNMSASIFYYKLAILPQSHDAAKAILAQHQIFPDYLVVAWISVFLFLGFLRLLPALGIVHKQKENEPK